MATTVEYFFTRFEFKDVEFPMRPVLTFRQKSVDDWKSKHPFQTPEACLHYSRMEVDCIGFTMYYEEAKLCVTAQGSQFR